MQIIMWTRIYPPHPSPTLQQPLPPPPPHTHTHTFLRPFQQAAVAAGPVTQVAVKDELLFPNRQRQGAETE